MSSANVQPKKIQSINYQAFGDFYNKKELFNQNFGEGLPTDYKFFGTKIDPTCLLHPFRRYRKKYDFKARVSLQNFTLDQIVVYVQNGYLVVEGNCKNPTSTDDSQGSVCRTFTRKYLLPEDLNETTFKCTVTSKEVTVTAQKKVVPVEGRRMLFDGEVEAENNVEMEDIENPQDMLNLDTRLVLFEEEEPSCSSFKPVEC